VATTNTGYLVTGQYTDEKVGKVMAKSYFGVGINDASPYIATKAVYDSLVLLLDYDYIVMVIVQYSGYTITKIIWM
jgi:hypothetical protein